MNVRKYKKKAVLTIVIFFLSALVGALIAFTTDQTQEAPKNSSARISATPTITPTPSPKDTYIIYLVGDSMTHALGPYGGQFNQYIHESYPDKHFQIQNYGKANQNILSLEERLYQPITTWDTEFGPIFDGDPDFLSIESFGYNPLSHLGLEKGLAEHTKTLDRLLPQIRERLPNTKIVFLATIAPDKDTYAYRILGRDPQSSRRAAQEREEYIERHIQYAQDNNIPLINVYEKSKVNGDGDPQYINPDDQIHPSVAGIELIARELQRYFEKSDEIR